MLWVQPPAGWLKLPLQSGMYPSPELCREWILHRSLHIKSKKKNVFCCQRWKLLVRRWLLLFLFQKRSKQMKTRQRTHIFLSELTNRKSLFINPSAEEDMFLWIQLKKQINYLFSCQQIKPSRSMSELKEKGTSLFKDTLIYICAFESDSFPPFCKHIYTQRFN